MRKLEKNIIDLLKKILPMIIKKARIIFGYDVSEWEVSEIIEKRKIPLHILINLGNDNFFLMNSEYFKIKEEEGKLLDLFFKYKAKRYEKEIKRIFSFIE